MSIAESVVLVTAIALLWVAYKIGYRRGYRARKRREYILLYTPKKTECC